MPAPAPRPTDAARVANHLAAALSNQRWDHEHVVTLLAQAAGGRRGWIQPLSANLLRELGPNRPSRHAIFTYLQSHRPFCRTVNKSPRLRAIQPLTYHTQMHPAQGPPQHWEVPALESIKQLSDWLSQFQPTSPAQLLALAGHVRQDNYRRYRFRWLRKRHGGWRLLESPAEPLRQIQRDILHGILNRVPLHPAAHGCCANRSVLSCVQPHQGQTVVVSMDIANFFPSITRLRVEAIFRTLGYPDTIADLLARLSCLRTPRHILQFPNGDSLPIEQYHQLRTPHLPQGGPTSPALANLAAFRLDRRLQGLADRFGAQYTRYVDDLVFSGGPRLSASAKRFHIQALAILLEEGFAIQPRKTRIMRQGVRQSAVGVVLNQQPNTRRADYKNLRAELYNCVRHGVEHQNRSAHTNYRQHLLGRIGWHAHVNPARGEKLRALYQQISWPE